jgi:Oxidoreductase family, NAD-binding Rossmann fold
MVISDEVGERVGVQPRYPYSSYAYRSTILAGLSGLVMRSCDDGDEAMSQHARQTAIAVSRRTFTVGAATATVAAAAGPGFFDTHGYGAAPAEGPADKLNIAVVGLGGQGVPNLKAVTGQNIVALCDVDDVRAGKAYEQHPGATKFTDFRKMFDALEKQIDAVVISTPDHTHFHPAWWAMERGKHVYLEKPLAHEVEEVRRLTEAARKKGLATQLGSQRHTLKGLRDGVEIVKSGPRSLPTTRAPSRRSRSRRAFTVSGSTPAAAARQRPATSTPPGRSRRACCWPTSPTGCRASLTGMRPP